MNRNEGIYAKEKKNINLQDCYFYHTIDLPGVGTIPGEWDLRSGVNDYLGNIELAKKRVLEMGTANGFLCYEMEKRGAEVIGYDLSENDQWDIVPYEGKENESRIKNRRELLCKINNAWWFAHKLLSSQAKVIYGSVYNIPQEIGPVDISTFGSILLHLRDPFYALQKAASLTTEAIVVTDWERKSSSILRSAIIPKFIRKKIIEGLLFSPRFIPDPNSQQPWDTWWRLTPELIVRYLHILGFSKSKVTFHYQKINNLDKPVKLFTVVGRR